MRMAQLPGREKRPTTVNDTSREAGNGTGRSYSLGMPMPRYFFDLHDGGWHRDEHGSEFASEADMRQAAKHLLPSILRDQVPADEEERVYTVVVSNESHCPVYSATVSFMGLMLGRKP